MAVLFPVIGNWYQTAEGETFEVVAVDDRDASIEIQYFDGAIEEIDLDNWQEMLIREAEPPEDWSGSMDIEREDYGVDLEEHLIEDWNSPLDLLDRVE